MGLQINEDLKDAIAEIMSSVLQKELPSLMEVVENKKVLNPELLSYADTSKKYSNSIGYWQKQVYEKNISYVKLGKSIRLRTSEIEKFISDRTVEV
ncbi:MAG: hypothetical protein U9N59_14440 [Campylobacterota bacterium]|nr:hypothetical protein [Campylobacterota bacterium]